MSDRARVPEHFRMRRMLQLVGLLVMWVLVGCAEVRSTPDEDAYASRFTDEDYSRATLAAGIALFSEPKVAGDSDVYDGSRRWSASAETSTGSRWAVVCASRKPRVIGLQLRPPAREKPWPELRAGDSTRISGLTLSGTLYAHPRASAWRALRGGAPLHVAYRDTSGVDREQTIELRLDTLLRPEYAEACE